MEEKNIPDWEEIKLEFVCKKITLTKLAEKHNVSLSTLNKRALRENWNSERQEYRRKVEKKIYNRMSNDEARKYAHVERSLQRVLRAVYDSLEPSKKELYKYLVKVDGEPHENIELEQMNTEHTEQLLKLIDKAETLLSRLYGVLPADKQREYDIALKQAECAASGETNDTPSGGVIIIPPRISDEGDKE